MRWFGGWAWDRWRRVSAAAVVVACLLAAGCSTTKAEIHRPDVGSSDEPASTPSPTAPPEPVALTLAPAAGATNVSPAEAITATMTGGSLDAVTLADGQGHAVAGEFAAEPQGPGELFTVGLQQVVHADRGAAGRADSKPQQTSTFTTVKPSNLTLPYLRANVGMLLDKGTFGVGQPIVVWFDEPIKDKAAAERTLTVTTDPPGIDGAWYWIDDHEVHWRPKEYWPAGTKVTVRRRSTARTSATALRPGGPHGDFTIGQSQDRDRGRQDPPHEGLRGRQAGQDHQRPGRHQRHSDQHGQGRHRDQRHGGVVDFTTNSGPHVVIAEVRGLPDDVGELRHHRQELAELLRHGDQEGRSGSRAMASSYTWRDWNVRRTARSTPHTAASTWRAPTSTGSTTSSAPGDIVDVTGTNRNLDIRNGLGDWVLPWDEWFKGSALS